MNRMEGTHTQLYRLSEISRQIDVLRQEQERIFQLLLPDTEPDLFFDDDKRRIYWSGGSVKLGKKSYAFVKTLWHGKDRCADLAELEENVWMKYPETETFIDRCTVTMLARHTQKNLNEVHFCYEIESVKNPSNQELTGFRLILLYPKKKNLQTKKE